MHPIVYGIYIYAYEYNSVYEYICDNIITVAGTRRII